MDGGAHPEHGGGVHAHILAAQCNLQTGRSLNIAPPGWQRTFDPLRDAFNHEHGWSRPDDPLRARAQRPGHVAYIEADTEVATGRMRELLMKAWLRPLVVGMSLFLGICGGSWATMHWLSRSIDSRIETLAEVGVRIVRARDTLAVMHETTWGVELLEINGDRYVSLPVGTPGRPGFTMDGRPYMKLSRE